MYDRAQWPINPWQNVQFVKTSSADLCYFYVAEKWVMVFTHAWQIFHTRGAHIANHEWRSHE
jgi:hypothetical protein